MNDHVEVSVAEAGEMADPPEDHEIRNATLKDQDGEKMGYLINWKTSIGAYLMGDEDSYVSLDEKM